MLSRFLPRFAPSALFLELGLILFVTSLRTLTYAQTVSTPSLQLSHPTPNTCQYHFSQLDCTLLTTIVLTIPLDNYNVTYETPSGWKSYPSYRMMANRVQTLHSVSFEHEHTPQEVTFSLTSKPLFENCQELHLVNIACDNSFYWNNYPVIEKKQTSIQDYIPDWTLTETMGVVALLIWFLVGCLYMYRCCTKPKEQKPNYQEVTEMTEVNDQEA